MKNSSSFYCSGPIQYFSLTSAIEKHFDNVVTFEVFKYNDLNWRQKTQILPKHVSFRFKFKLNLNPNNWFFYQRSDEKDFVLLKFLLSFSEWFFNGKLKCYFFQKVQVYFLKRNQIFASKEKSFWRKDIQFFSLSIWFVNMFRFNWQKECWLIFIYLRWKSSYKFSNFL